MCSIIYRSSNDSMILKSGIFFHASKCIKIMEILCIQKLFFLGSMFFFIQNVVIL